MGRKSGNKYSTEKCGRCGEEHQNYSGKLDAKDVEYVVCGNMHKRMNISDTNSIRYSLLYLTQWNKMGK